MKGKFIKKLMAYALAAAMVVSTPMTAFATEFSDNFSVSDGVPGNGNDQDNTGTVSGTGTDTTTLKDNWDSIAGIKIVETEPVTLPEEETTELTAEVIYKDGVTLTDEVKEKINKKIRWKTTDNADYTITIDANIDNMTKCTVNAKKEGTAGVKAELNLDNGTVYESDIVTVNVIGSNAEIPITSIDWDYDAIEENTFYAGHSYDLNEYLLVNGLPYYTFAENWESVLRITYATDADPKKQASITQQEVPEYLRDILGEQACGLTVSRSLKNDDTIKVYAKFANEDADNIFASYANDGENDEFNKINSWKPIEATFKIAKGVPSKHIVPSIRKATLDFGELYDNDGQEDYEVGEYYDDPVYGLCPATPFTVGLDQGTTDTWTWTSKNSSIAGIVDDPEYNDNIHMLIVGRNVGKTTITVTASSGKKANVSVRVDATLKYIESVGSIETWSGKTTPVEVTRIPAQNTEKLKITSSDKKIKVKGQAIVPAANLGDDQIDATITVSSYKKNSGVDSCDVDVIVYQSDVTLTGVERYIDVEESVPVAKPEKFKYLEGFYTDDDTYYEWLDNNDGLGNDEQNVWRAGYIGIGDWADTMTEDTAAESLSWTSSNPAVASVNGGLVVAGGKPGTAKITVSSVGRSGNGYKTFKKSFNVKVTPVCEAIVLKSQEVANVAGKKVTLSVKQLLPKKTIDEVNWFVQEAIDADGNLVDIGYEPDEAINPKPSKKLTFAIPAELEAGSQITLRVESGVATTYARIYVLDRMTKRVQFRDENGDVAKTIRLGIGELKLLSIYGDSKGDVPKYGGYSVNKSGVVKVLELKDGRAIICGVGKGKATITAEMASGKKAKVTVIVE